MVPYLYKQACGPHPGVGLGGTSLVIACFLLWKQPAKLLVMNAKWIALTISYPILMLAYQATGVSGPNAGSTLLVGTVYGLLLGLVFVSYVQSIGLARVTNAIFLGCATLTLFSLYVVHTIGPERIVKVVDDGTRFQQSDASVRIFGIFGDPNIMFWIVAMTATTACSVGIVVARLGPVFKLLHLATMAAALYCNFVTATRTIFIAWAVTFLAVIVMILWQPRIPLLKRCLTVSIMVGLIGGLIAVVLYNGLIPESLLRRLASSQHDGRFVIWAKSGSLIVENPFGGSAHMLRFSQWAHNHILDAGLDYGWLGIIAVGLIFALVLTGAIRATRLPQLGRDALPLAAATVGCIAVQMSMPPNQPLFIFTLSMGTLFHNLRIPATPVADQPPPPEHLRPVLRHRLLPNYRRNLTRHTGFKIERKRTAPLPKITM